MRRELKLSGRERQDGREEEEEEEEEERGKDSQSGWERWKQVVLME